jgi:hypothetical protein
MNVQISDYNTGTTSISTDWVRISPYAGSGMFTSRVIDAGVVSNWDSIFWKMMLPMGTAISVSVRYGNSTMPDATWSGWYVVLNGSALSRRSRYLQYQVAMSTTDPKYSPLFKEIGFTCTTNSITVGKTGSKEIDGTVIHDLTSPSMSGYVLGQNYPNPFTTGTTIPYTLPVQAKVRIAIYDIFGRTVRVAEEKTQAAGSYSLQLDPHGLARGIYYYVMLAGEFRSIRKMIIE